MHPAQLLVLALAFGASWYLAVRVLRGADSAALVWAYIAVSALCVHLYLPGVVFLALQAGVTVVFAHRAWVGVETSAARWLEVQVVLWVLLLPSMYVREPATTAHALALG
jgi:hypothetical protein